MYHYLSSETNNKTAMLILLAILVLSVAGLLLEAIII